MCAHGEAPQEQVTPVLGGRTPLMPLTAPHTLATHVKTCSYSSHPCQNCLSHVSDSHCQCARSYQQNPSRSELQRTRGIVPLRTPRPRREGNLANVTDHSQSQTQVSPPLSQSVFHNITLYLSTWLGHGCPDAWSNITR